jgi:hypothetical protein
LVRIQERSREVLGANFKRAAARRSISSSGATGSGQTNCPIDLDVDDLEEAVRCCLHGCFLDRR